MKKSRLLILFLVLLSNSALLWAQTEPEEIKQEVNKFQDFFFESLKQKGIENYDKAIVALEQCLKIEPENATIHFELGKNYLALKDYKNAYTSFEHAAKIDPTNKWFWVGMYDVNYAAKDFNGAIYVINKLIPFDSKFKEDLTSLYMNTNQYDKAWALINELNETSGKSDRREAYKMQILSQGKYQNAEIENLIGQIKANPKEESNYISLIFLYSKNNETNKVLETARKLELAIPTSEWAQVSLFKTYLENKDGAKAVIAMNMALASSKIDSKIKHRVLNEFLIFVNSNPQFTPDLEKAIGYFDNDPDVNVAKEVGKFYQTKKQWSSAVSYYELANKKGSDVDIETNLLLLQAYTETKQFEKLAKNATEMIDVFPTQPQFYYYAGLGSNQLAQYKKAKEILEMGLDYLVDDLSLETNFNIQLGEAYNGLGDAKKKDFYFSKANQLLKK
ncbi:tetratricopeptide repeat protein [Flavobacterium degerlachei]|jgi:tetratricopeptide (TPR) repeat protein|uniref:Tetratricopeptide repeat-containing protein n=1 Tax=Flavobacterium degerlachei TaxID=229203 RepID=A0A1H2R246_9FLAO|nr:tetratricopeptide repeat protein [Flavobacterium degerlachei]SDW13451.1 Tetratricopeptide repeat-containing protein [Flavobacterium degerlachei]